jgi:hypothetical protein
VSKKIVNQWKSAQSAIKKCGIRDSEPKTSICRKSKAKVGGEIGEKRGKSGDFGGNRGKTGENGGKKEQEKRRLNLFAFLLFTFFSPHFSPHYLWLIISLLRLIWP